MQPMKTYEEIWNEAIEAVERRFREKPLSLMDICALKKPESMSDLTEARLGILESDFERFFEDNGGLCGDDFRCLKRLISEVRRWREEHVTAFEHGIRTEARIQLREPKPHVHKWSRTQPPFDNVSKFG